nr:Phage-related protein tail component [uncultured Mediterranean phage uvMED]
MGFLKKVFKAITKPFKAVVKILTQAISWLIPTPDIPDFGVGEFDDFERGILLNKQSNDAAIPVVYGERLIGGTRVFLETSGTDNEFLYMALVMSEGEINAISEIRVDDKVVTFTGAMADNTQRTVASSDSNFYKDGASYITIEPHFGSDSQSASSLLSTLSSWTSNHKLSGLAYLALKFKWNQDIFGSIPKVQAKIQGKKIVTLDASLNESSETYSTNPAFCILDYLRNERYGKGIATADIDLQSFRDASQVCITQVTPFSGGSDINLFDTNAVLDTSKKVISNLRELITGCRGFLPYASGKYKLVIETTGSASITLTEDDIIGGYTLSSPSKRDRYNRVIVSFVNPDRNFQADEIQYPAIDDSGYATADKHATMKTADGGFLLEGRFSMKSITSPYQAEEMAEIILRRSRESLQLAINVGFDAYDLVIGDLVNITHSSLGFSAKTFRVMSLTFNEDFTIGLGLVEYQGSHYTFAPKTEQTSTPSTTLPNPFVIQPPAALTLTDEMVEYSDGIVITRLNIAVTASPDSFVSNYQVEAKKTSEANFKIISTGSQLNHEMLNVIDDIEYTVRVKAINSFGVSSSFISETRKIVGGVDPPSNVEDFAVEMHGQDHLKLTWTPPSADSDLDISFYEIRYQDVTSGAVWLNSSNLVRCPRRKCDNAIVPARTGSYLIKAIDKNGNSSAEATIVTTNISAIQAYNLVSNFTETPDVLTSAAQMDSTLPLAVKIDPSGDTVLTLDTVTNFDDTVGNFDSPSGDFELGGTDTTSNPNFTSTNRDAKGFFNFTNSISLSNIYDGNVEPSITLDAENPYDLFDSGRGSLFFDSAKAPFDGTEQLHAFHRVQIATSTTSLANCTSFSDITQSATFKFKFAKFRLKLTNDDNQTSSNVKSIAIKLNMEDRIFSENDLTTSSGSRTITFTNPFFAVPAIGIAAQNMQTGDTFTISSKTINGFSIAFANSSGSAVDRTFDYIAKGYGLQTP